MGFHSAASVMSVSRHNVLLQLHVLIIIYSEFLLEISKRFGMTVIMGKISN